MIQERKPKYGSAFRLSQGWNCTLGKTLKCRPARKRKIASSQAFLSFCVGSRGKDKTEKRRIAMRVTVPTIELLTSRSKLTAGVDQTVDVLVRITPPARSESVARRPRLNLSLVLDLSGSMDGEKMDHARKAAAYCIDQLIATDG